MYSIFDIGLKVSIDNELFSDLAISCCGNKIHGNTSILGLTNHLNFDDTSLQLSWTGPDADLADMHTIY